MRGDKYMDELLSIALWVMMAIATIGFVVSWFTAQSDFPTGLGLQGVDNNFGISASSYTNPTCEMTSLFEAPGYAICFLNELISPILGLVKGIWKILTNWQLLLKAIFGYNATTDTYLVPAGDLFVGLITPFLTIMEIGAAIVILMRLAAIIRGVAGGFL
jgi:hypothetical protein